MKKIRPASLDTGTLLELADISSSDVMKTRSELPENKEKTEMSDKDKGVDLTASLIETILKLAQNQVKPLEGVSDVKFTEGTIKPEVIKEEVDKVIKAAFENERKTVNELFAAKETEYKAELEKRDKSIEKLSRVAIEAERKARVAELSKQNEDTMWKDQLAFFSNICSQPAAGEARYDFSYVEKNDKGELEAKTKKISFTEGLIRFAKLARVKPSNFSSDETSHGFDLTEEEGNDNADLDRIDEEFKLEARKIGMRAQNFSEDRISELIKKGDVKVVRPGQ